MQQDKKVESKGRRKHYSDEELTALGIFKEKEDSKEEESDERSD
jgi:hypothetical protein